MLVHSEHCLQRISAHRPRSCLSTQPYSPPSLTLAALPDSACVYLYSSSVIITCAFSSPLSRRRATSGPRLFDRPSHQTGESLYSVQGGNPPTSRHWTTTLCVRFVGILSRLPWTTLQTRRKTDTKLAPSRNPSPATSAFPLACSIIVGISSFPLAEHGPSAGLISAARSKEGRHNA